MSVCVSSWFHVSDKVRKLHNNPSNNTVSVTSTDTANDVTLRVTNAIRTAKREQTVQTRSPHLSETNLNHLSINQIIPPCVMNSTHG